MTEINLLTFISILKQVVIDMAYAPGVAVNTFGYIQDAPDLRAASLGFTHEDFLNGHFWSRDWVNGGAKAAEITYQFPIMLAELNTSQRSRGSREFTHLIDVMLLDQVHGDHEHRTGPQVYGQLTQTALAIMEEVERYRLYDLDTAYQWAVPERQELLFPDAPEVEDMMTYLRESEVDLQPWGDWATMRGLRWQFKLVTCEDPNVMFKYDHLATPLAGSINCGC